MGGIPFSSLSHSSGLHALLWPIFETGELENLGVMVQPLCQSVVVPIAVQAAKSVGLNRCSDAPRRRFMCPVPIKIHDVPSWSLYDPTRLILGMLNRTNRHTKQFVIRRQLVYHFPSPDISLHLAGHSWTWDKGSILILAGFSSQSLMRRRSLNSQCQLFLQ